MRPASLQATLWRVAVAFYGVVFMALVVTGTVLVFVYRPDPGGELATAGVWRIAHAVFASVALWGALPTLVIGAVYALNLRPRRRQIAVAAALLSALGFAGSFTGFPLPWDQVAVFAAPGEPPPGGYLAFFSGHDIRFVQVGGVEVGPGTLRTWLLVHLVVGVSAALAAGAAWWGHRRRRRACGGSIESPA